MTMHGNRPRVALGSAVAWMVITLSLGVTAPPAGGSEQQPSPAEPQAGPMAATPQGESVTPAAESRTPPAGMLIYIDPQTGALLREPAPGTVPLQLTPALQGALSTSDQGLIEVPSPAPGGGVSVNLQGHFQSPLFVTTDANGNVRIQHLDGPHEPDARK